MRVSSASARRSGSIRSRRAASISGARFAKPAWIWVWKEAFLWVSRVSDKAEPKGASTLLQSKLEVESVPPSTYLELAGIVKEVVPDAGQLLFSADWAGESESTLISTRSWATIESPFHPRERSQSEGINAGHRSTGQGAAGRSAV